MRRAAVADIFDQLGLGLIPGRVWVFTDDASDLADGLAAFFFAVGLDSEKLVHRDEGELRKAAELFDLFNDVGDAFERLGGHVAERIQRALFSGDFDSVRAAARAVRAMERIHRAANSWPPHAVPAIFRSFLKDVEQGLADPLTLSDLDVAEAETAFAGFQDTVIRFDLALAENARIMDTLGTVWPSAWTGSAFAEQFENDVALFERIVGLLRTDISVGIGAAFGAIEELEFLNGRLDALLDEAIDSATGSASAGAKRGGRRKPFGGKLTILEEALVFFGFDRMATPTDAEITKAFRDFMRANHPDFAGPDEEERMRREERCKAANVHRDNLLHYRTA